MIQNKTYTFNSDKNLYQRIIGTLVLLAFVGVFLYLFYHVYRILFFLSPIFLIAAVIIYPRVVGNHIKIILQTFKASFIGGMLHIGLQLIGLPLVSIGLIFKAWAYKNFGVMQPESSDHAFEEKYTAYEEVMDPNAGSKDLNKKSAEKEKALSGYDDLFE
ncbi:MAG: hypothetical protein IPP06_02340 [Saprospiraceae bacterium]|nr:hypothetical protein [Candidatus Vicinibacter affinis]MBP6172469.1 hypothetical protein [Saprospiraceae bacterium]MBK6573349.1 hypothetical protein [Candidatus Vicinibacter affinis]MBK6822178.1 hypothetical protein [Candidatus Vicinibacter affinis]MBK7302029.1 hypothetical protein [Candidatus Vicinibacter affinis]